MLCSISLYHRVITWLLADEKVALYRRSRSKSPVESGARSPGRPLRRRLDFDELPDQAGASQAGPDQAHISTQQSSSAQRQAPRAAGAAQSPPPCLCQSDSRCSLAESPCTLIRGCWELCPLIWPACSLPSTFFALLILLHISEIYGSFSSEYEHGTPSPSTGHCMTALSSHLN